ncbi:MAG: hypothetical protein PHR36_04580 [Patescibacteria group bacterium]|nr:hypothetical protein [Patescibacteria group bacterium]
MVKIFQFNLDGGKDIPEKAETGEEERLLSPEIIFQLTEFIRSGRAERLRRLNSSKESGNISTDTVKGYTGEELIGWLGPDHESEWTEKPSFFQAILEELQNRVEITKKQGDRFKDLN